MYRLLCTVLKCFMCLLFRIEVKGAENMPSDGNGILCANHISNWDPVLLQTIIKRRIYYMAKDELFHVFFVGLILKWIKAIPVKRTGSDLAAVKSALKTLQKGEILGIFPTGQREKKKGEGEVKAGVGLIAGKTKAPVIPVHIIASFKIFSKVTVVIGKPKVYSAPDGEKLSVEMAEGFSKDIYKNIKSLS